MDIGCSLVERLVRRRRGLGGGNARLLWANVDCVTSSGGSIRYRHGGRLFSGIIGKGVPQSDIYWRLRHKRFWMRIVC